MSAVPIDPQLEYNFSRAGRAGVQRSGQVPRVADVSDRWVDAAARSLIARCYQPLTVVPAAVPGAAAATVAPGQKTRSALVDASTPLPAILYLHGGAWVGGDLESCDLLCRTLANACRALVVALDYRRAPDAALLDALAAVRWMRSEAAALGIDPQRIAIAGDEAGAHLAVRTLVALRDAGDLPLVMQVLISPVLDLVDSAFSNSAIRSSGLAESVQRPAIERHLDAVVSQLQQGRDRAFANVASLDGPALSPLRTPSLVGLPPAFVLNAGADPVLEHGKRWVERLHAVGIEATHECFEGMVHGFVFMGGELAGASHAMARMTQQLRPALRRRFT